MSTGPARPTWEASLAVVAEAQARTAASLASSVERLDRIEGAIADLVAAQAQGEARAEARMAAFDAQLAASQALADERKAAFDAQMADSQARADARLAVIDERLAALTASQARTDEQLVELKAQMAELAEAHKQLDRAMTALAAAQQRTEEQMVLFTKRLNENSNRLAHLDGQVWEWRYRLHAPSYFAPIARRIQVLTPDRMAALLDDAVEGGRLTEEEADEIERADLICRGRLRSSNETAFLLIEVSAGIGPSDVRRAIRRADLLSKTGTPAVPVVAGQSMTAAAADEAKLRGVWRVQNGNAATADPEP